MHVGLDSSVKAGFNVDVSDVKYLETFDSVPKH